jgi:hypothetical protein
MKLINIHIPVSYHQLLMLLFNAAINLLLTIFETFKIFIKH